MAEQNLTLFWNQTGRLITRDMHMLTDRCCATHSANPTLPRLT